MTLSQSQRSSARFFAAFYRWNLQSQSTRQCTFSYLRSRPAACYTPNGYRCSLHTIRRIVQKEPVDLRLYGESQASPIANPKTYDGRVKALNGQQSPKKEESDSELFAELSQELDHETEALKLSLRKTMRNVPSSVAVLTVASVDADTGEHVPMGVAVSSFTTVSLDPPTVSFNIKEPSKTLEAIRAANGLFRVHIPSANMCGANVVEQFSRGNHAEAYSMRQRNLKVYVPTDDKDSRNTKSMAPQIWNDEIQASMECTVTQEIRVADHVIMVAKVDSLENKDIDAPAILYVRGQYLRANGTVIQPHIVPAKLTEMQTLQKVWECPHFPGEKEQREYMECIKAYIQTDESLLELETGRFHRLRLSLPYPPAALGINLKFLVAQCRREKGLPVDEAELQVDVPVLSEFYGRITPSSRERIVERAKAIVSRDDLILSLPYGTFLQYLGVARDVVNFLPTDLMKPLRAAGLIDAIGSEGDKTIHDIARLEKVQHKIVEHLRTISYDDALAIDWGNLMLDLGELRVMAVFFKIAQPRLLTMTHPHYFSHQRFDISGEVTQAEERVVLRRIVQFLYPTKQVEYRKYCMIPPCEVLRRVGVHPLITGMDIEYFFAKINHLYRNTPRFRDFAPAIDRMLDAWFDHTVAWDDLVRRVRTFVEQDPLHATKWSTRDKLAALGLHDDATVAVPGRERLPIHLNKNVILHSLYAQALRNYHGRGSEEVNAAIAAFLKADYGYTVHPKPEAMGTADDAGRSSGDEVREAMMAGLNVDVSAKANEGRVARRYDNVERRWKSYSLAGEKK